MPWTRPASTVLWTLGTALCVYALFTGLVLYKVSTKLIRVVSPISGPGTARPTGAGGTQGTWGVEVQGYFVPWWVVLALWLLVPCTFLGFELFYELRRRHRDKLGQCIECGDKLRSHRG